MKVHLDQIVTSRSVKKPKLRVIATRGTQVVVECDHYVPFACPEYNFGYQLHDGGYGWRAIPDFVVNHAKHYYNFQLKSLRPYKGGFNNKRELSRELIRLYRVAA